MFTLLTEIDINASPSHVWQVLMDFDAYPQWNPFIVDIKGGRDVGDTLCVTIQQDKPMQFRPTVTVCRANQAFHWQGKLWIKGLFDGEHCFELHDNGQDGTRWVHKEHFSGLLSHFFKSSLMTTTKSRFESMNIALKQHCETGKTKD